MTVFKNSSFSYVTYCKIGGKVKFLLEIENHADLLEALNFVYTNSIQNILCLGLGSNILISDEEFDGAVLRFIHQKNNYIEQIERDLIKVFASHNLDDVIKFGFNHGLIGLEWAGGLPSTVGAAVRGNVGAFGGEIKNSVERIEILAFSKEQYIKKELKNEELEFSYRDSLIKRNKNLIVSWVYFRLKKASAEEISFAKEVYYDHIAYRKEHHPMNYPSCGSVFKNIIDKEHVQRIINTWPEVASLSAQKWHHKVSMGYVIDRLGFTGKTNGGAQVSEKHANYIINKNNASFDNVFSLITEIKEAFKNIFGFYPEPEVEIIN